MLILKETAFHVTSSLAFSVYDEIGQRCNISKGVMCSYVAYGGASVHLVLKSGILLFEVFLLCGKLGRVYCHHPSHRQVFMVRFT